MPTATDITRQIEDWIEEDRDEIVAFLSGFLQAKSPNPPGDTREASAYVEAFLTRNALPYRLVSAQDHLPNIVGSIDGASAGRHLVLNGHMDVFPAIEDIPGERGQWSGDVTEGRVYGRGAADMKCGTTAALFAYRYAARLKDRLTGRLTLTVVSDEETGGRWGTGYLMETIPDEVVGDCCLDGEPSGLATLRFGEKGALRAVLTTKTKGAHGAYPHLSESAVKIAAMLVRDLESLAELEPELPDHIVRILAQPDTQTAMDASLGDGAAAIVGKATVNVGVIRGGLKVNMMPDECVLEVEIRMPPGLARARVEKALGDVLARYPSTSCQIRNDHSYESSWCDPDHEMAAILQDVAEGVTGRRPLPIISLGGSDARYWRYRGVPAYLYGPSPKTMGRRNEHVTIDELLTVVKVHAISAVRYLCREN
ncbi:M20 family peptidase [Aquibium carbonis]|uniref:M20 family peptidase n=1 Tax=Aquibium carbonis TaxID=2495581 RepID=A0A429YW70_9HYPH|nr:M20/M25/M40 family metallo-hydrolase [Aquibium carbonis]RST85714.1 M20 family peptidase [Aquibium carbonis]